jgi:Domain of unknown function (DUF222)
MFDVGVAPCLVEPDALGDLPPGPGSAAMLTTVQLGQIDDWTLTEVIRGWERVMAWSAAEQLAAVAELARRRPPDGLASSGSDCGHPGLASVSEFAVDEVAAALRLSRPAAGARLHLAVDLAGRLPDTAMALRAGDIDVPKARAVVEATTALDGPTAAAVEGRVLPRAGGQTAGQLRANLARATLTLDPAGAQNRHEQAMTCRRVTINPHQDGMAELWALLPAEGAAAVRAALDVAARACPASDTRSMDARRADALIDLVTAGPSGARPAAHVSVTVPATTLLGHTDEPGELAGHGPIPASMARRLAVDGTWRRILTDPASGTVLDVGRTTYSPPAALAGHVQARDGTCRFPGCRQPAKRCDLDHTTPYPQGTTSADNLAALCRHHHRLKHDTQWQVQQHADGTLTWTAPTGHQYTTQPHQAGAGRGP